MRALEHGPTGSCSGAARLTLPLIAHAQARATAFVADIKANPEVWRLCCERFPSTQYSEVRFWCLQTLHEVRPHRRCKGGCTGWRRELSQEGFAR